MVWKLIFDSFLESANAKEKLLYLFSQPISYHSAIDADEDEILIMFADDKRPGELPQMNALTFLFHIGVSHL